MEIHSGRHGSFGDSFWIPKVVNFLHWKQATKAPWQHKDIIGRCFWYGVFKGIGWWIYSCALGITIDLANFKFLWLSEYAYLWICIRAYIYIFTYLFTHMICFLVMRGREGSSTDSSPHSLAQLICKWFAEVEWRGPKFLPNFWIRSSVEDDLLRMAYLNAPWWNVRCVSAKVGCGYLLVQFMIP